MISRKSIEEINFATKIEEVVGDFVPLKRQGQSFVGVCPFHDDRNPSLHVTPRLGIYKCFVCDAKGNAITFLMEHGRMTYPEALEYLARKYSIPVEYDRAETPEEKEIRTEKESLYLVNEFAEKYFADQLLHSEEGRMLGLAYLKERGFKDATIEKFHLGYCPGGWDTFTQEALKKGYREEFLIKLGLTKKSENGRLHDFYRGRVIFPIHNTTGKVIGFGGRVLKKDEKTAKYFNSPENEIYHKSETLYDIYLAKKSIRQKDNVYLVEGYTDVISLFESGVENVVASSGTSLTNEQVRILGTQTRNITVLYDGDRAGIKASLRGIDMLLEKNLNIRVCLLPDGEDPDSFAKKHRDSELVEYLNNNTTDFLLFKTRILSEEAGDDPLKRAAMVKEIVGSIAKMQDQIAQSFYIQKCAAMFGLSEDVLNRELRSCIWKSKNKGNDRVSEYPGASAAPEMPQVKKSVDRTAFPEDLLGEAEKNVLLLLIKHGLYEINVKDDETGESRPMRIDQYVFDDLYADGIVLRHPLYRKMYEHYAEIVQILRNQDDVMRSFLYSQDEEERSFALENLTKESPEYSPHWESRYDIFTHSVQNNAASLQDAAETALLLLKMRLLEWKKMTLEKQLGGIESEEESNEMLRRIVELDKARKEFARRLGMNVSR